jgi:hypothetical protein
MSQNRNEVDLLLTHGFRETETRQARLARGADFRLEPSSSTSFVLLARLLPSDGVVLRSLGRLERFADSYQHVSVL